ISNYHIKNQKASRNSVKIKKILESKFIVKIISAQTVRMNCSPQCSEAKSKSEASRLLCPGAD
ncbi:unnamed protein product, partial [Staurois parvus]